jgi:hypothetical protein
VRGALSSGGSAFLQVGERPIQRRAAQMAAAHGFLGQQIHLNLVTFLFNAI